MVLISLGNKVSGTKQMDIITTSGSCIHSVFC